LISVAAARALILNEARSFGVERVALEKSFGRVLAKDASADRDYPPFNRSAMDGFAIVARNYNRQNTYTVQGTIFAGDAPAFAHDFSGGQVQAIKIMTGAAVPKPFDAVIPREDARETAGQTVTFETAAVVPWQFISRQGEDLRRGTRLPLAGSTIDHGAVTLLASIGVKQPWVAKLPRVVIITTGNEIIPVKQKPKPMQIRNANAYSLQSMLARCGITQVAVKHAVDTRAELGKVLRSALRADVVLVTGGVSAGDSDHVPEVLQQLRVNRVFHRTAMKPGKPLWFGTRGKTGVFAIPGNPFSAQVVFHVYVAPFLRQSLGLAPQPTMALPLSAGRHKKDTLQHFFPVRIKNKAGSTSALEAVAFNGSGDIRAGWRADGLAVHPAEKKDLRRGDIVEFLPW